jgi:hypothetical protein
MSSKHIAIARVEGQVSVVQGESKRIPHKYKKTGTDICPSVVQSSRASSHVEIIKYAPFGGHDFLLNVTSSPPMRLAVGEILQFLPSSLIPSGDILTLTDDLFKQFIDFSTANQHELEAKWQRGVASGAIALPHIASRTR